MAPLDEPVHTSSGAPGRAEDARYISEGHDGKSPGRQPRRKDSDSVVYEAALKQAASVPKDQQAEKNRRQSLDEVFESRVNYQSGSKTLSSDETEAEPSWRCTPLSVGQALLQSNVFSCITTLLTVFVLVGDDIRLVAFEKKTDPVFDVVTIVSLVLFTVELILSSLVKEDYFLGFWFVLDTIATVSLVFDITYISEAMMGYPDISIDSDDASNAGGAVGQSEYARASRSSRVGARVARLLRVVRLIRISRIMKCFDACLFSGSRDATPVQPGDPTETNELGTVGEESRVGKKLSEKTTQRVFIIVLCMLFVVPQLNSGAATSMMSTSAQYGADVVYKAWEDYETAFLNQSNKETLGKLRKDWETELLMYIYYHNWHAVCPDSASDSQDCAAGWQYKLCFVGYVDNPAASKDALDNIKEGYIEELRPNISDWDLLFSGGDWRQSLYVVGTVPDHIKQALTRPWTTDCSEPSSSIVGVSLLANTPCPRKTFRQQETMWYVPGLTEKAFLNKYMQGQFVFVFDIQERISWQAIMSMMQTVFIVLVLGIGAFFFSKDTDNLVLLPIERMISKVEQIRKDPLYAIKLGDQIQEGNTTDRKQDSSKKQARRRGPRSRLKRRLPVHTAKSMKKASLETKILENAIIKLGSLLALGFGEAGSEIIGQNLDDDNATVDAMIPGSKVEAIYGFCDIRHFSTVTEVLQEKTMVFVNQVANIAHRIVDEHLGAPNKNLGEAFLLVWRVGRYAQELRSKIADLAVMSFIQVVAELSRDAQLAEYREHPALLARLPNFRVSLGFGLHLGWSIEGAIGSEFKIDASYLSPHVNIATLLQAETFEYGVTMLMSEPLVRFCNPAFRRHFRPIDHVKFQGSKTATRLFTVDLNCEVLPVNVNATGKEKKKPQMNRYQARQEREKMKLAKLEDDFQVHQVFDTDKNVKRMRERFFLDFFQEFEKGYLNYEAGEWKVAHEVLGKTRVMLRAASADGLRMAEDGPSRTLLDFMATHDYQAPIGWPGYRELAEKGRPGEDARPNTAASARVLSSPPAGSVSSPVPSPVLASLPPAAGGGGAGAVLKSESC